jgi:hypothetical protein
MRQSVTISQINVPNVIYKIHCFEFSANLTTQLTIHLFNVRKMLFHTCAVVRSVAYVQILVIFNVSRFEASKFDFVDPLYFSLKPGTIRNHDTTLKN